MAEGDAARDGRCDDVSGTVVCIWAAANCDYGRAGIARGCGGFQFLYQ